jgi:DNA-binding response OmpR family regulator
VSREAAGGILIVEDEAELVRALRINLRARQYEMLTEPGMGYRYQP